MTRKRYAALIALALFATAASLSGCGSSSTTASSQQTQAAKASVSIAASFPGSGSAVKSLIPAGTQAIVVYAQSIPYTYDSQNPNGTLLATLTVASPSATVQMTPGMYTVTAIAYNSTDPASGMSIGSTTTAGEVKAGQSNTIVLSFLNGQWTMVDSSDSPTPVVLSDGTQFIDFIIGETSYSMPYKLATASKSSIDYTKPVGGGSGPVRLRFSNNTSARTHGWMASQFVGTTTGTMVGSDSYNLTQKCGWYSYMGMPCDDTPGDKIVMIAGKGGYDQSGGAYAGTLMYGSEQALLPNQGQTSFTQNGTALDLMAALPDTTVVNGSLITGGVIEWNPASKSVALGTPAVAKPATAAKVVKAQSTNTTYANLAVKDYGTIVCSGSTPQNRGTWSFANYTSSGKVIMGGKVCYTTNAYLTSQYDPITFAYTMDKGDYSYGLFPTDTANLGDYCHQWDYTTNTCTQQLPGAGDVYYPGNFRAIKTAAKTAINYGSFKFNFWKETNMTGTAYVYPFRAKGSTTVRALPAPPAITSMIVPGSTTPSTAVSVSASASDPNGDAITTWGWSIVNGGGSLTGTCSGTGGTTPVITSSACSYTPPASDASVTLRFSATDATSRTSTKDRTLSVSAGTIVLVQ